MKVGNEKKVMKVGSDFSGVGAFEQALIRLGIDYANVFACDLDKYVRQAYIANYGEPDYYPEDVYERKIPEEPLDIYMTSPPCQAFSIAGRRKGEKENRGILFYNSHQFICQNRPRFFIFENVKGLLSDDGGKTFQRWVDYLARSVNGNPMIFPHEDSAKYHVYHTVLNTKDYDIPQNRERVFIVGIRDDEDNNFRFPKALPMTKKLKDILEDEVDDKYYLSAQMLKMLSTPAETFNGKFKPHTEDSLYSNCLTSRYHKMSREDPYWKDTRELKFLGALKKHNRGDGSHSRDYSKQDRVYDAEGIAETIPSQDWTMGHYHVVGQIRKLTPRECFRLQDFPDSFKLVCSDTQNYKMAGNSISVGVLVAIIKNVLEKKNIS